MFGGFFPPRNSPTVSIQGGVVLWEGAELCHDFSGTDSIVKTQENRVKTGSVRGGRVMLRQTNTGISLVTCCCRHSPLGA